MDHKAILNAIEDRKRYKRHGLLPKFEFMPESKRIIPAKRGKQPFKPGQIKTVYPCGCNEFCFCCSDVGKEKMAIETECPVVFETEQGINTLIDRKRCHSRLNHRRQYSGVYRRRLDREVVNEFDQSFNSLQRPLTTNSRTRCIDFMATKEWVLKLRNGDERPVAAHTISTLKSMRNCISVDCLPTVNNVENPMITGSSMHLSPTNLKMRPVTSQVQLVGSRSMTNFKLSN